MPLVELQAAQGRAGQGRAGQGSARQGNERVGKMGQSGSSRHSMTQHSMACQRTVQAQHTVVRCCLLSIINWYNAHSDIGFDNSRLLPGCGLASP